MLSCGHNLEGCWKHRLIGFLVGNPEDKGITGFPSRVCRMFPRTVPIGWDVRSLPTSSRVVLLETEGGGAVNSLTEYHHLWIRDAELFRAAL